MKATILYPDGRVKTFEMIEVEPGVMESLEVLDDIIGATIHWPALDRPYQCRVHYRMAVL